MEAQHPQGMSILEVDKKTFERIRDIRTMKSTCLACLLPLLFVACATPTEAPEPTPPAGTTPRKATISRARPPPKAIKPPPIPTRAITVRMNCAFRDEIGYNGSMKLAIEQARVQAFEATVNIPRHGSCRFDLRNFRQTREMPTVELSHVNDRCIVRVWEQGERLTVAFQECQKMCSGNAWEHLWPILTDTREGSCA
jgi:hypothetical protein